MASAPFPTLPASSARTLRRCRELALQDGDVFVASYPKSGTTWTQNIVFQLLAQDRVELDHISDFAPFFEVDATWRGPGAPTTEGHRRLGRRIFNTHLHWSMMPTRGSTRARVIYLVRNGKDVAVSFYHHLIAQLPEDGGFVGTWEEFFTTWLAGGIAFGGWADHLRSWLGDGPQPQSPDERVLVVHYEDLQRDLPVEVARIARHLDVPVPRGGVDPRLLERMSLAWMKAELPRFNPRSVRWRSDTDFRFVRKGRVGDHLELFTAEQHAAFEAAIEARGPSWVSRLVHGGAAHERDSSS